MYDAYWLLMQWIINAIVEWIVRENRVIQS